MPAPSNDGRRPAVGRRRLLTVAGAAVGVASVGAVGSSAATVADGDASITFDDQTSDGRTVVVAAVSTEVDAHLMVFHPDHGRIGGGIGFTFDAGETATDVEVVLDEVLAEGTTTLTAEIHNAETGQNVARSDATITVEDPPDIVSGFGPELIEGDPSTGFNYPYFLYAPDADADADPPPILVEPTNTGTTSDDFATHREAGRRTVEDGPGRTIADRLPAPFLVPVFPRPRSEPVDGTHYVHALDDTTMAIEGGDLERVDRQLLAMIDDASERIADRAYPVRDGVALNGFSASGNFVNRFAALHPDRVVSVTAGGLNGMPILPIAEAGGRDLPFHVGIGNLPDVTGDPFDRETFREVPQFLYIGELDRNDTIPGTGSFTDPALRETALAVFGPDPVTDRFPYAKAVYEEVGVDAVFRMYEGAGHAPQPAVSDLVAFHDRVLDGEGVDDLRATLGGNVPNLRAHIEYAPTDPTVGEQVAFDATRSAVRDRELVEFEWAFGDGDTATGELVEHTFETAGGHNVRLTATDDAGETYESTRQVVVTDPDATQVDDDPEGDDQTDESIPGFGVGAALAALGTAGYALRRRADDEAE